MTLKSFLVKTKGWLLSSGTYATIQNDADWYDWCADGSLAWAEKTKIELTGLAAKGKIPVPQGWSVQEMLPPKGFCYGLFETNYTEQTAANNLPWWCEIHDFWTTTELTDAELQQIAGATINQRVGPGMNKYEEITATGGDAQPPFEDWEQVVACRSRTWAPTSSAPLDYGRLTLHPNVRKTFVAKLHDNQWGSMEPIGTLDLYHCRLYRTNIDTQASETIEPDTGTFCDMPPSLQPFLVEVVDPNFITEMTIQRRSKGI
tara:strand:- start:16 stop:795 length:780 start_codon:yes stop_codon:yes gene_type:complete